MLRNSMKLGSGASKEFVLVLSHREFRCVKMSVRLKEGLAKVRAPLEATQDSTLAAWRYDAAQEATAMAAMQVIGSSTLPSPAC